MKTNLLRAIVFTVSSCLWAVSSYAQTNVSGGIYANTTWTKINSPYIVTDTVVVFPNVTLTIEPGVVVRFDDKMQLEIRQGSLIANGTSIDSITFTSNSGSPHPGSWGSVFLNLSNNSPFNYCNFRYAKFGLVQDGANTSINHSVFSYNNYGCFDGSNTLIDSSSFIHNTQTGVIGLQNATVTDCDFSYNHIGIDNGYNDGNRYTNCTVNHDSIGLLGLWSSRVTNCTVKFNFYGIISDDQTVIYNSTIDSNSILGVHGEGDTISNCRITNNGVGLELRSHSVIVRNIIDNNSTGIQVLGAPTDIYCNKICNNSTYNLAYYVVSGDNSIFSDNYWCTTDSSLIAATIYDGYDNVSYGLVSILPLDTIGCYLTGCNLHISSTVTNAACDTCHTGSATAIIAYGFAPFIYTWNSSPIQTTQTATGLPSGNYTVCVMDANGCTACKTVFVDSTNCTGFSVSAQSTNATCSTCNDGLAEAIVTSGAAPYFYSWYTAPIQTTDTAIFLPQGTYVVCVNDANGCTACDTVVVSVGSCSAHFNLYPDTVPHNYTAVNMASGAGPLTYLWNWGDGNTDTGPFPSHTYAGAGLYSICLSITDSVGCTNTFCNTFFLQRTTNTMVYVNVVAGVGTGISTMVDGQSSMVISPNPASNSVTINIDESMIGSTATISDITGRKITAVQLRTSDTRLPTVDFSNGIYFVTIENETGRTTKKLIIQK